MSKPESSAQPQSAFITKFNELISAEEIIEAACRLGAIKRQRKVDLPALVQATVLAMTPVAGTQTTAFGNYIGLTGVPLAPSAFYDRFSDEFAELMKDVANRVTAMVREVAPADRRIDDFGVLLKSFSDIRVADSTALMVKRLARSWFPSTSKRRPAGVKFHTVISLHDGLPLSDEVSAQRLHDNRAFAEWTIEPGTLSLFDLGYMDQGRLIDAAEHKAAFITRMKTCQNPIIARVHTGKGSRLKARGHGIGDALMDGTLIPDRGVLDLDVVLEAKSKSAMVRAVGIEGDGERHWYLTNLDRGTLPDPSDVGEAYRLRWTIELVFKQLKSGLGLSSILAWRASAVTALLYAKVVGLALVRLLELSLEERNGRHATTQLALALALCRCAPMLLTYSMMSRGVTLQQLEERILMIAGITARSRNQRRERTRRAREQALGASG